MLSDICCYVHFSSGFWAQGLYNMSVVVNWLTLDELSEYLKTPKSTLYKLSRKGFITGHKLGKRLLFDREEVDRQVKLLKKGPGQEVAHGIRRKQAS